MKKLWLVDFVSALFLGCFLYFFGIFTEYKFGYYLLFDVILTTLIITSCIFMALFISPMNKSCRCSDPFQIPWPSFICMIVLATVVTLGYAYYFIFKFAFRECPHSSDGNLATFVVKTIQRIAIIIMTILCVFYMIKRSFVGAIGTNVDLFCRFIINTTLVSFRLDLIGIKLYHSIENICESDDLRSMLKVFCPQNFYNESDFDNEDSPHSVCNATVENEFIWIKLDKNLLDPAILSMATELVPVLLAIHWLVSGYGEQRAEILARQCKIQVSSALKVPSFVFNMVAFEPSLNATIAEIPRHVRSLIYYLSSMIILISIGHWLCAFYMFFRNYDVHTLLHNPLDFRLQEFTNYVKFTGAFILIVLRLLIFLWTRNIPCCALDLNHMADSTGDKIMIYSCLPFLVPAAVVHIAERVYFLNKFGQVDETAFSGEFYNMAILMNLISKCLEAFSLARLLALPKQILQQYKCFLPMFLLASIAQNCCDFFGTYFELGQISRHINRFIVAYRQDSANQMAETFTIISVMAKLLNFSNFLFTFTCALGWIEIILRYRQKRIYETNKVINLTMNNLEMDQISRNPSRAEDENGRNGMMRLQD